MTTFPRTLAASVATAALALALGACGGGEGDADAGGAPTDASKDDFCKLIQDERDIEDADQAHDFAEELADTGTPDGISQESRDGFEALVDFLNTVDDDDIKKFEEADDAEDPQAALDTFDDIFGDDGEKVIGFVLESTQYCSGGELGEQPELPNLDELTEGP